MFCEKCGTKNEDAARFCEKCGATLEVKKEKNSDPIQKNAFVAPRVNADPAKAPFGEEGFQKPKKKPMSLKTKIILSVVGILLLVIGLAWVAGSTLTNPERIVRKYYENMSLQKYDEAYKYIDVEDSEFMTKDMFVEAMENTADEKMLNFTLQEASENNSLVKKFIITYTRKGGVFTSNSEVFLMKQPSKKWLLFDDYKIVSDKIAKSYSITIPSGAEIYIDDIKVDEKYTENDAINKKYRIPSIFKGMHEIKVSAPFGKEKTFDVQVIKDGCEDKFGIELTDQAQKEVSECAKDFLKAFVAAAMDKTSLEESNLDFSNNADMESVQKSYNSLKNKGIHDGVEIKDISFQKFDSKSGYGVSVNYGYTYTMQEESESGTKIEKSGSATIYVVYEDGKWMISNCQIYL